jgi:hypothetical protein
MMISSNPAALKLSWFFDYILTVFFWLPLRHTYVQAPPVILKATSFPSPFQLPLSPYIKAPALQNSTPTQGIAVSIGVGLILIMSLTVTVQSIEFAQVSLRDWCYVFGFDVNNIPRH